MQYANGTVLQNRYRILSKIGAGAHGIVYRARDLETRDEVALKFLGSGKGLDPELNRRLEREAQAMAQLRGTHAVHVHGIRISDDGMTYIVMEMLHGRDMEDFLSEAEKVGGRLKRGHLLGLLRPVVDTLEAAHSRGIIHRDLKPSNIFIVDQHHGGGVRLLDFGLVKVLGATPLTQQGTVAGSPSYIAPEAWRGEQDKLDQRVDVFSLGVIVFRALSAQMPCPDKGVVQIYQWAIGGERPSLRQHRRSLPKAIDGWVQQSLAGDPEARFPTVRAQWNALEHILAETPTTPY